jgi:hypothetical protein
MGIRRWYSTSMKSAAIIVHTYIHDSSFVPIRLRTGKADVNVGDVVGDETLSANHCQPLNVSPDALRKLSGVANDHLRSRL